MTKIDYTHKRNSRQSLRIKVDREIRRPGDLQLAVVAPKFRLQSTPVGIVHRPPEYQAADRLGNTQNATCYCLLEKMVSSICRALLVNSSVQVRVCEIVAPSCFARCTVSSTSLPVGGI